MRSVCWRIIAPKHDLSFVSNRPTHIVNTTHLTNSMPDFMFAIIVLKIIGLVEIRGTSALRSEHEKRVV